MGSFPGSGRSTGVGNGTQTPVFLSRKFHGLRAWRSTIHGVTENRTRLSDFTEQHSPCSLYPCDHSLGTTTHQSHKTQRQDSYGSKNRRQEQKFRVWCSSLDDKLHGHPSSRMHLPLALARCPLCELGYLTPLWGGWILR